MRIFCRYPSARVLLQVQGRADASHILPPTLTIEYTEIDVQLYPADTAYRTPVVNVQVSYTIAASVDWFIYWNVQ